MISTIQIERQVLGAQNMLPSFEDIENVFDWSTAVVALKVFRQPDALGCCQQNNEVEVTTWKSDGLNPCIVIDTNGFSFTNFVMELPIGNYAASVQITTKDIGPVPMWRLLFNVANS